MRRFRLLIADDNDLVRRTFVRLLKELDTVEIVGEASNGCAAVELVGKLRPDAVLMDIHMPFMDGIEASRIIHSQYSETRVIGLSTVERDTAEAMEMLNAGAAFYICKCEPWESISEEIHHALAA